MVVFGETLAMIEFNLARLDATHQYGLSHEAEKSTEPTPITPYLEESGLLKTA